MGDVLPRLRFRPEAWAEIREARRWYEREARGLGRAFLAEVDAALAFAQRHPRMYQALVPDGAVRRVLLHRFPYALVYEAFADVRPAGELVVLACFHLRREPPNWADRR